MRKNDKPNILYHTPLNTKFRGKPVARVCVCVCVRANYFFEGMAPCLRVLLMRACTCVRVFSITKKGESSSQSSGN